MADLFWGPASFFMQIAGPTGKISGEQHSLRSEVVPSETDARPAAARGSKEHGLWRRMRQMHPTMVMQGALVM